MATLRELLGDVQGVTQLTQGAQDSTQALRQQLAQKELARQAPALLASNDVGQIASLGLEGGDPTYLREMIKEKMKPAKAPDPNAVPFNVDQLKAFAGTANVPLQDKEIAGLATLPRDEQIKAITLKQRSAEFNTGEQRRQETVDLAKSEKVQDQREAFNAVFQKNIQKLKEDEKAFNNAFDAAKQGSKPADAVVFNFLARQVGGEKGPLSEGDVARFIGKTFAGDAVAAKNWATGATYSTLTDEQRSAYADLMKGATNNFQKYKDETLGGLLADSQGTFPKLFGPNAPDRSITEKAKRAGYEVKKGEDGYSFVKAGESKTVPGEIRHDGGQTTDVAGLYALAEKITDPKTKAQAVNALQKAGPAMTPERAKAFRERLMQFGGQ